MMQAMINEILETEEGEWEGRGGEAGEEGRDHRDNLKDSRSQVTKVRGGGAQRVRMQEANRGKHGRELNGGGGRGGASARLQVFKKNKHTTVIKLEPQSLMKYLSFKTLNTCV